MLNRIYAELKNVEITWKGKQTTKDKKEYDQCQGVLRSPDGRMEAVYFSFGSKCPAQRLNVGDKINALCGIRSFKDSLYLTIMNFEQIQAAQRPKAVVV